MAAHARHAEHANHDSWTYQLRSGFAGINHCFLQIFQLIQLLMSKYLDVCTSETREGSVLHLG